jgi:hypothetical protein
MSIFTIFLVAALNLLPPGVTEFSLAMPKSQPVQFIQQPDGGWKGVKANSAQAPLFYIHGTELTMKTGDKEMKNDLATMLGVTATTNWKELTEVKIGEKPVQIQRQADGLDFVVKLPKDNKDVEVRYPVRWTAAPKAK